MITKRKAKLSLIHTAKRQVRLSDEHYRALLLGAAGVETAAEIEQEGQFRRVMDAFRVLGFVSTAHKKTGNFPTTNDDDAWWGCTPAQKSKIKSLWAAVARNPSEQALRAMAARICHVDALNFLDQELATKLIIAFTKMAKTKGLDLTNEGA